MEKKYVAFDVLKVGDHIIISDRKPIPIKNDDEPWQDSYQQLMNSPSIPVVPIYEPNGVPVIVIAKSHPFIMVRSIVNPMDTQFVDMSRYEAVRASAEYVAMAMQEHILYWKRYRQYAISRDVEIQTANIATEYPVDYYRSFLATRCDECGIEATIVVDQSGVVKLYCTRCNKSVGTLSFIPNKENT